MNRLLLISSSRTHGTGFLDHCESAIRQHLTEVSRLLFIPFALADHDGYAGMVAKRFRPWGIEVESLHRAEDPRHAVTEAAAVFVGGGNSFRLLKTLYDLDVLHALKSSVQSGMPYMGSSAGTNMACPTIKTTNDMPIVEPPSLKALGLITLQINPHYLDATPDSQHQGETRETRLREYLEENTTPVIGLREGSWLQVVDHQATLSGDRGAVWFSRESEPRECTPGEVFEV